MKGVKLDIEFDESIPKQIHSDEKRVRQVLLQLLSNSLKFTYGGKISLQAKYQPSLNIIEVAVIDTGIGIDEERLK